MRKPRDFDSELKVLGDKAKALKERKVRQLGELVTMTGADALDAETLAGALILIAECKTPSEVEVWRRRGRDFFQGKRKNATRSPQSDAGGAATGESNAPPDGGKAGAA